ncbi:MAG: N-acetylmannosamine-6-phosphate 2-epimerase [Bacteroidota bacterium]|nr:N-acetylmannosamine-6-phosphate 2-epimerase [Bacteroidota bacterium]
MTMEHMVASLEGGLIVSCHAEEHGGGDGFDALRYFARAAIEGGAVGLRIEGAERLRAIREMTKLPLIGFVQGNYPDGSALITPSIDHIEALLEAGADIVAIDATKRKRPGDLDGFIFFEQARKRFTAPLWADVANFREGVRAAEMGADIVATTLAGYTPGTVVQDYRTPDFTLIRELSSALTIPVIAEGRIWTPEDARRCTVLGAHAVVVGSAITRPQVIARMYVESLQEHGPPPGPIRRGTGQ